MKRLLPVFLFLFPAPVLAQAQNQPVISEFMARNTSTMMDEDGAYSDWIEIHNPTDQPIELAGWHLTDREDNPTMWRFPATVLPAGGYLVVFASNKDRRIPGQPLHTNFALAAEGEYLGLIAPDGVTVATEFAPAYPPQQADVSYGLAMPAEWRRLAGKGDPVRVLVPDESSGPAIGASWRERLFDDSSWMTGTLAVGFKAGANDPLGMRNIFETDVQSLMHNLPNRLSVYLRVPFHLENPSAVRRLELRTQYDDGYAAFLNGGAIPVDSANAPAHLDWLSGATAIEFDADGLSERVANLDAHLGRLVEGENIFAFHGMNANRTSSDLLIAPRIYARIAMPGLSDRNGYFPVPTPGAPNPGPEGMTIFREVIFSTSSRPFSSPFALTLEGAETGQTIRYTTDGSLPGIHSTPYSGPISIQSTTLLRARIFDADGIGGPVRSNHYIRLAAELANRRSNLPMVVLDAHGQTLSKSPRRPAYFHLFDRDEEGISALARPPDLSTRQGIRWRGSTSVWHPKRPYSVEFWDDHDEQIRHPLLGMRTESDWVFYAPYNFDRAFIRNSVAYEMSRRIGRWAPETRFAEVFFNANGGTLTASDYAGVYAIIEQIKMNTRRLGHRTVDPGDMPPPGPIEVVAEGAWTGGYLFKIDRTDPDEYDWRTNRGIPSMVRLTLNRPKMPNLDGGPYFSNAAAEAGSRQVAFLRAYVQAFEDALYGDQANGFLTREHLDFIERDSWVDHLILNAFTKNVDALRLSAFFHKPENRPIIAGPVWDFDRSMDSYDGRDDAFNTWNGTGDATDYFTRDWWGVLARDPDFRQAFYDRWAELRRGPFSNEGLDDIILPMGEEIDNSSHGLGSAAQRDAARWSENRPRSGGYPAEIQHLLTWMKNRAAWMDRRRTDGGLLPLPPVATLSSEPLHAGGSVSLSGSGGPAYFRLDGGDPRGAGGAIEGTLYTGPVPIDGPSTLVARIRGGNGEWSTPTLLHLLAPPPAPVFLPGGNADWTDNANWDGNPAPYPHGPGQAAVIGPPQGESNRHVELGAPVTIGRLSFPQGDSHLRNRVRDRGEGNNLTFAHPGEPARLVVGGTGAGFVEFEVTAGTRLEDTLEITVSNLHGHPEYGALRLRQGWHGPGGLIKKGPGMASLTGENKNFQGPTRIEEGVLRVTGPSTMAQSPSITVLDGGQLRLVSAGSRESPRVHSFGGDLFLSGEGRGADIPAQSGFGRLGALRYDPGSQDNHASVTNGIILNGSAGIHVDGSRNLLELTGPLGGTGELHKSGGGTLALSGQSPQFEGPVFIHNGTLRLRGGIHAALRVGEDAVVDAAGFSGPLAGAGELHLPATSLRTPSLTGLRRSLVFTREGLPDPLDPANSGNALLLTEDPGQALGLDLYIDDPISPSSRYQGGYFLPMDVSWAGVLDPSTIRVFTADANGEHLFLDRLWTTAPSAGLTRVPVVWELDGEPVAGRIMEIRFDEEPLTFEDWRRNAFPDPADLADAAISGPEANPAGDGIPNLMRFAWNLPVEKPRPIGRFLLFDVASSLFSFPYDPGLRGLRWLVEMTDQLTDWSEARILFDSATDPDLPDDRGRLALSAPPAAGASQAFFRLRIIGRQD